MVCPNCGVHTDDPGLCVTCYDAEIDADDSRPAPPTPRPHNPEYNYNYDRDYRLAHKEQINAYRRAWRARGGRPERKETP